MYSIDKGRGILLSLIG